MVDVISARLQEAYIGWKQKSIVGDESKNRIGGQRPSGLNLRNAGTNNRRRISTDKDSLNKIREANLFQIKEIPSQTPITTAVSRPFMGSSCIRCTPGSRETTLSIAERKLNVINVLHFGQINYGNNGFFTRTFCDIIQALRVRKYDYPEISQKVIKDESLRKAIELTTQETLAKIESQDPESKNAKDSSYDSIYKSAEKRSRLIVENMKSAMSDFLLRLTSWVLYKLLPGFISSIAASPTQIEMLKKAGETGLPVIFVPLHRSHLDYVLVTFILLNTEIRCPFVAAGDNLKLPFFGWLLRGLGAFYIKRRLDNGSEKDLIYRAALRTYILHCLGTQSNIEFFIEGGRSRTGKPLLPKGGILSVIVDAYLDGTIEDALLVPVSMNYEKLVEGNFVKEQTGMPKQMESFTGALKSIWKVFNSHYGNTRIDFNQPFSLRELVRTFQQFPTKLSPISRTPSLNNFARDGNEMNGTISIKKLSMERHLNSRESCSSLYGTDVVIEEHRGLVDSIARHIVYDCSQATAVMSTNAVAFLLLTKYRGGCTLNVLAQDLSDLICELHLKNRDVGFSGESIDVVNHAIKLFGPDLIITQKEDNTTIIKPVVKQPNVIELSYYCYGLFSHYALQSIILTALQTFISMSKSTTNVRVRHSELLDLSLHLCEIMSQEFILCKPCQKLENTVQEAIGDLICRDILQENQVSYNSDQLWSRRIAHSIDDGPISDGDPEYIVNLDEKAANYRYHLQNLLRPLIEAYSITIACLPKILYPDNGMSEADFVKEIVLEIEDSFNRGECKFGETMSVDAVKNCLRLLKDWGIIESHTDKKVRMLYITKKYKSQEDLNNVYSLISKFKSKIPHEKSVAYFKR